MSDRRLFLKQLTAGLGGALVAREVGAVDLEDEGASYVTPATPPDPDGLIFFAADGLKFNGQSFPGTSIAVSFSLEVYPAPEQWSGQYGTRPRPIVREPASGFLTMKIPGFPVGRVGYNMAEIASRLTIGDFGRVEWKNGKHAFRFQGTIRRLDLAADYSRVHVVNEHPAEGLLHVSDGKGWYAYRVS